jgi:hypothetical protein
VETAQHIDSFSIRDQDNFTSLWVEINVVLCGLWKGFEKKPPLVSNGGEREVFDVFPIPVISPNNLGSVFVFWPLMRINLTCWVGILRRDGFFVRLG